MSLKPFIGKFFVQPIDEQEEVSESGIITSIRSTDEKPYISGRIVDIGEGFPITDPNPDNTRIKRTVLEAKVGDTVIYNRAAAIPIKYKGKDYFIIVERDIIAIDSTN
ncbi:MAG: co-chaperone GroES family protein [Candidatus Pacearchaeota archaeon]